MYFQELVNTFNFHGFDNMMQASQNQKVDPRLNQDQTNQQALINLLYSARSGDLLALER